MTMRSYSELIKLPTFTERLKYLRVIKPIGVQTFGKDRYLNQMLYHSLEWKHIKDFVIQRDSKNGYPLDLGCEECIIYGNVVVHHMNPITVKMLEARSRYVLDPEYLITASFDTHQAIHGESYKVITKDYVPRRKYDTCPWRT